jgi:DOPA 4,5-dioxygenase
MIVCVAQLVHGHSTHYNLEPEVIRMYEKNGSLPPFRSYHIHVMFIFGNEESVNTAMALRARFVEHFNLTNTANCTGLFDQGRLCMFEVHTEPEVHTPFVSGQWAVFLRTEDFPVCVPWVMQNRGSLDVLVHPNSGMGYNDHFYWPVWGGTAWPINGAVFK